MANDAIFYPTFHGDAEAVRALLEDDAQRVEVRDAKQLTPLHVAASRGQAEVIRVLLEFGADIDGPSAEDQWTPLVFASYRGHLDAVRTLLENGAGATEADGNPIHFAGQRGHRDVCRLLVEHGAVDDLVSERESRLRELFRAAYSYDHESVDQILTESPELVESLDRNGRTALHEACTQGDIRTVKVLLRHGASADVEDHRGQTPRDRAESHRQRRILELLA